MPERAEFNPKENLEQQSGLEIETKILDVDIANLETNLRLAGAKITKPERLISDSRFNLEGQHMLSSYEINVADISQNNLPQFVSALKALGFEVIVAQDKPLIHISGAVSNKKASVRLRSDGSHTEFTVKTDAGSGGGIKRKHEYQAEVENKQALSEFLQQAGYVINSHREKKRTTYEIDYSGTTVKIEINVSPNPNIKPWIEIEAPTDELVIKVAQELGFNKEDFFEGSDKDLYKKHGLGAADISNMEFIKPE